MAIIRGTSAGEMLFGTKAEDNSIAGNGGNDLIFGRGGNDLLLGGKGNDVLFGRNGHDEMYGGAGDDYLSGGNGRDTLSGDKGNDTLRGGNGNDTFVINANLAGDGVKQIADFDIDRSLRRMTFDDTLELSNAGGHSFVFQETVDGNIELYIDGELTAVINGSRGSTFSAADLLSATEFSGGSPSSVSLLDADGNAIKYTISGTSEDDQLSGVPGISNTIAGNDGGDLISGRGKADVLLGNSGNDTLMGTNGNDTLFGGGDDDDLHGGNGADLLNGDKGADTLEGGNGADTFVFNVKHAGTGVDTVTDFDLAEGDTLSFMNVTGTLSATQDGADVLIEHDGALLVVIETTDATDMAAFVDNVFV